MKNEIKTCYKNLGAIKPEEKKYQKVKSQNVMFERNFKTLKYTTQFKLIMVDIVFFYFLPKLFQVNYPIINETLQIEDSDEEDSNEKEKTEYIDKENFEFIQKNIDDIIMETLDNFKIENHYKMETEYLKTVEKKVECKTRFLVVLAFYISFMIWIDYLCI